MMEGPRTSQNQGGYGHAVARANFRFAKPATGLALGLALTLVLLATAACEDLKPDTSSSVAGTAMTGITLPSTDTAASPATLGQPPSNTTLGQPTSNTTLGQPPTTQSRHSSTQPSIDLLQKAVLHFYEETDSHMNWGGPWSQVTNSVAHGGGFKECLINGSVFIRFEGTGVQLYCMRGPDYGYIKLMLDGQDRGKVDLYADALHSWMVWQVTELPYGQHWLRIEETHDKNPDSTGDIISLDGVVVEGILVQ
jgi:hypothetical protein